MYRWFLRISVAAVGVILLVMVRALEWYPVFYIFPLTLILLAFADCANSDDNKERPVVEDVRKVVIRTDNRRWNFSDEEYSGCYENNRNKRIHKILM